MARRDVDLVIRARDEAKGALDAITKTLSRFTDAQRETQAEARETDTQLDRLGSALSELQKNLRNATGGGAVERELEKARTAFSRVEQATQKAAGEAIGYRREAEAAAQATARLSQKSEQLATAVNREEAAVAEAKAGHDQLTSSVRRAEQAKTSYRKKQTQLTESLAREEEKLAKQQATYARLGASIAAASEPTARMTERFERAAAQIERTRTKINELTQDQQLIATATEQANRSIDRAQILYGNQASALDRVKRALAAVKEQQSSNTAALRTATNEQARLEGAAARAAATLGNQDAALERAEASLREVTNVARQTEGALTELEQRTRGPLLRAFGQQVEQLKKTEQSFRANSQEASRLAQEMRKVEAPSRELQQSFEAYRAAAARGRQEIREQQIALSALRGILRESGGDIDTFASRQNRFAAAMQRSSASFREYQALARAAAAANEALARAQDRASSSSERQRRSTRDLGAAQRRAAQDSGLFAAAIRNVYGESRTSLSFMQRLRGEVLSLLAAYGGFFAAIEGVREMVNAFQTLEAAQNRLSVVFDGDNLAINQELDFVRRTAERLGIQFGALSNEYTKFAVATKGTNLEGRETRRIFQAVAEAGRVQSLSLEQLQGTFVALTQIVSKGTLSMEELRQQLGDRLPGAIQLMADGLNITTAELIKMVEQGQITSDSLSNFAGALEEKFGQALPESLTKTSAALGFFQNAIFQTFIAVGEGGAIRGFVNLLRDMTETLQSAQFKDFATRAGAALEVVFDAVGALAQNFDTLIVVLTTLIGFKLAPFVVAIVTVMSRLPAIIRLNRIRLAGLRASLIATSAGFTGAATAVGRLRLALTALLSSTGIGLLVTLIGAGIGVWATRTSEATVLLQQHQELMDKVRNAYDRTAGSATEWKEAVEGITITQARGILQDLQDELTNLEEKLEDSLTVGGNSLNDTELGRLFIQYKGGLVTSTELVEKLNASVERARKTGAPIADKFIRQIEEAARRVDGYATRVNEVKDVIIALGDSADDTAAALKRLNNTDGDNTDSPGLDIEASRAALAQKRADSRTFEIEQQRRLLQGLDREAAIEAARKAAQDKKLSAEEVLLEVQKAGILFDEKARDLAVKRSEARKFELSQQLLLVKGKEREATIEAARKAAQDKRLSAAEVELEVAKATIIFDSKAAEASAKRAQARSFEVEQQRRLIQGLDREAAIEQARRSAKDQNLSAPEVELEVRKAATIFDEKATAEAIKRSKARVFELEQQRRILDGKEREAAIEAARKVAQDQNLSASEVELEVRKAASLFDSQATNEALKRSEARSFELSQQQRILAGLDREAAIESARKAAQDQNLSASEVELEVRQAAAIFDAEAADSALKRSQARTFEIEQQRRILNGMEREAAIEAARKDAKDRNLSLSETELEIAKTKTLFDAEAAKDAEKRAEARQFEIEQQRRVIKGLDREAAIEAARRQAKEESLSIAETELEVQKAATLFDEAAAQSALKRAEAREFEVEQQQRLLDGMNREAAIEAARKQAKDQNLSLAETELEVKKAAAIFDAAAADDQRKRAEARTFEIEQQRLIIAGKEREAAIEAARRAAETRRLSAAETELEIRKVTTIFDEKAAADRTKRETALQFQIDQQRLILAGKDREAAIEAALNQERTRNKAISEEELALLREKTGELFDLKNTETNVNEILAYRNQLRQQLTALLEKQNIFEMDDGQIAAVQEELEQVNGQLQDAIGNAIELFEALKSSDPAVQSIISKLKTLGITNQQTTDGMVLSYKKIEEFMSSNLASAADSFAQSLAEGKNVTESLKDAFLQFASDFLRQIAQMIIQQLALNAVKALGRSFGFGVAHSGGVIGGRTIQRKIDTGAMGSIVKYHSGGIAGLQPGEVPTILKRGEEVLTEDDPRHIFNARKGGSGGTDNPMSVKVLNLLSSEDLVSEGLNTRNGEKAVMNIIRGNPEAVKAAIDG